MKKPNHTRQQQAEYQELENLAKRLRDYADYSGTKWEYFFHMIADEMSEKKERSKERKEE
jgi:hypothetical protein